MKLCLKGFILLILFVGFLASTLMGQNLNIKVSKVRNDKGHVLLMISKAVNGHENDSIVSSTDKDALKPIMRLQKACNGSVNFVIPMDELKKMHSNKFIISVFHDENGNYKLDMNDQQRPIEGFIRRTYSVKQWENNETAQLNLYYPISD
ncbi:MAG: DUF2141 domain-containing protein [Bacteroidales bacterium]|nr:DUF2141 domain-containing protein [Bacteroidales bacterium]